MNHIEKVTKIDRLLTLWPFFLEGMTILNKSSAAKKNYTPESFLRYLCSVLQLPADEGVIMLLLNKRDLPLGFVIGRSDPFFLEDSEVLLVIDYESGKCPTAEQELQSEFDKWAFQNQYRKVITTCRRLSSAAKRRFTKRGFRQVAHMYEKVI